SSPSLHKTFFQQLPNISETVVPRPPTPPAAGKVSAQRVIEDKRRSKPVKTSQVIYAMDILRTKTSINNQTLPTLINTGSMINVMQEDIARELGLDLMYGPNLTMVIQSREAVPCTVCAEDVPVSIGDITTHTPIFIVQGGDQDFILSHPFTHLI
ncbi:retroviral-like aspartic protease, partial [Streptomyces actuosus]